VWKGRENHHDEDNSHLVVESLKALANIYGSQRKYTDSADVHRKIVELARSNGDEEGVVKAMKALSQVLYQAGDDKEAGQILHEAFQAESILDVVRKSELEATGDPLSP
jgi:hypothetical protein